MDTQTQQALLRLTSEISILKKANNSCVDGMVKLQKKVTELETTTAELEREVEELQQKVEDLESEVSGGEEYVDSPS